MMKDRRTRAGDAGRDAWNEKDPGNDPREERVEKLLLGLEPVDVPPFFREQILAKVRRATRRAERREWFRSPQLAWSVVAVCVVALALVVVYAGRPGAPVAPGAPGIALAESNVDLVTPAGNSVVGAGDVQIVAAIDPPVEGGIVRLYVDESDVTGLAEVTESYVMYSPAERLAEGEHIVTIEIRDGAGRKLKDVSWLFYTLNGRHAPDERV